MDLRITWQRRGVFIKSLHYAVVNSTSQLCSLNVTAINQFSNGCHIHQSLVRPKGHFRTKITFSNAEYPEVTANMVGLSTTPSKTKEKQPIARSDESDSEPEGVYRHTRTRTGMIAPVDCNALAQWRWSKRVTFCHCGVTDLKLFHRERSLRIYGKHSWRNGQTLWAASADPEGATLYDSCSIRIYRQA